MWITRKNNERTGVADKRDDEYIKRIWNKANGLIIKIWSLK